MRYIFEHAAHLPKDEVAQLYPLAKAHSRADIVFYDGVIRDWRSWVDFITDCKAWVVRVRNEQGIVGFFWLNGYMGRTAMMHFCVFDSMPFEDAVELGRQSVAYVFKHTEMQSVYGCTPRIYRHVFPFIKALGFRILGEIPGACYIKRKDKYVPGVVSVRVREEEA